MFLKRVRLKGLVDESKLVRMTGGELKTRSASAAAVVDVRLGVRFAKGHFPGSLNVGLGGRSFVACVSLFVPQQGQTVLVVDKPEDARKAQLDLARAGLENVAGFITAGDLPELHQLTQLDVLDLYSTLSRGGKPAILDIRSPGEWKWNGIPGSRNIPLVQLPARVAELSSLIRWWLSVRTDIRARRRRAGSKPTASIAYSSYSVAWMRTLEFLSTRTLKRCHIVHCSPSECLASLLTLPINLIVRMIEGRSVSTRWRALHQSFQPAESEAAPSLPEGYRRDL